jgi:hypothetical protein
VRLKPLLFMSIILVLIMVPVAYAYTDPVSLTLVWQFLASIAVGVLFFFRQIKFFVIKTIKKIRHKDEPEQ